MFLHIFVQEKLHLLASKAMKQYDRLQWSTVPEAGWLLEVVFSPSLPFMQGSLHVQQLLHDKV